MRYQATFISKILLVFIVQILAGFGCREKSTEPPIHTSIMQLTAYDVGVTDAWLQVKFNTQATEQRGFTLRRNGQTILTVHNTSLDTLILDEQLFPKHTYIYKAYALDGALISDTSDALTITTMDTTSHTFTWEIYAFGDGASHGFRDVSIINDTCIWVVGEINAKDSLGNWINPPYNMTKWDGHNWSLSTTSDTGYGYGQLFSVFTFTPYDVWVGSSIPEHWDGQRWTFYGATRGYKGGFWIRKIWGTNSQNLYVAGDGGNIRHFNGTSWEKVESGTDLDIIDIYGATSSRTGEEEILAVASKRYVNYERKILKINGTTVTALPDSGINTSITGVWFNPGDRYYVVGDGIFRKRFNLEEKMWIKDRGSDASLYYKNAIRANAFNDIFVACDLGDILHYNGQYWKSYLRYTHLGYGNYYSIATKGNLVIAVGDDYGKGVIAVGRK